MRLFTLAFVLGTVWLQQQAELPLARTLGLAAVLLLATALARGRARIVLVLCAGFVAGFDLAAWRAEAALCEELPVAWEGRDVELTGVISGLPQPGEKGTRFLFDVEEIATPGARVPGRISLTWFADRAKGAPESVPPPALVAGERWRLAVRLKRPRGLANPHGFDFEPWALERGIRATGYVRAKAPALRLAPEVPGWPQSLHRLRGELREAMNSRLGDARFRGVLVALAIGDQDAIAPEDWKVFWRTGVGHLVSISGLHITMLASLAFTVAAFLWVRVPRLVLWLPARKAGAVAAVVAATGYTLIAGYAVPSQRTMIMVAVMAACVLSDRHTSPSRVLAAAALAVLAIDPWAVLSPGFWLSFGAVGAIFWRVSLRTGKPSAFQGATAAQVAVTVAMLPMLLALFQEVSVVSPIANAFAIPVVSLVVVPLTLAGLFLPVPALLDLAHLVMQWVMVPLEWLAALPGAVLESHEPGALPVACAVAGGLWLLAPRGVPMRWVGAVWFLPIFLVTPPAPPAGAAWVDVLDVGQGLAVVVRTAGHALVYDAGPYWNVDSDSGSRIVVPFLRGEGVRRLDTLVVTHADEDHSGGAVSVATARRPEWILSTLGEDDELHLHAPISRLCITGVAWEWDGVAFEVLHPGASALDDGRRRENDRACTIRVSAGGGAALLTSDGERLAEAEMLARGRDRLRAEVLLAPHHGSRTSSTPAFLDAVSPRVGLFSVGYRNRFRHPYAAIEASYRARGIAVYRTDYDGALHVEVPAGRGQPISVATQSQHRRYWSERRPSGTGETY